MPRAAHSCGTRDQRPPRPAARRTRRRRPAPPRALPPPLCAQRAPDRRGARRRRSPPAAPAGRSLIRRQSQGAKHDAVPPLAGRAGRPDAQENHVAIAVLAQLLHGERVPGGLALAPEPFPGAAPEPGLAGLAGQAERLGVHPREHQHAAGIGVLDDRGVRSTCVRSACSDPKGHPRLPQLDLQLRQALRALVHDRRDDRFLCSCSERIGEIPGLAGAARRDQRNGRLSRPRRRSARGRNPARVPSASIKVTRSSPAPRSTASRAHSTACATARIPAAVRDDLAAGASIAQTTACAPNSAAS